jgi:hypothetical protein
VKRKGKLGHNGAIEWLWHTLIDEPGGILLDLIAGALLGVHPIAISI